MFGTITNALPPSGEKQLRKLAQNWSGCYTFGSFGSSEILKMGGGGGKSQVVTYIHRLSAPPPPRAL